MKILITDGMDKSAMAQLAALGHELTEHFFPSEELGAALREFDAVVIRSATKIRKQHLQIAQGGRLKVIIRAGVGVDNIDVADAEAMGIAVRNTPCASTNAVAELAVALMFSCARYVSAANHTMKEGIWEKKAFSKGFELTGKTLGVIGFGRIGMRVAEIAEGIGMNIIAFDMRGSVPNNLRTVRFASLEEVLANADVITVHVPALDKPIIRSETIAQMKDGVVIVNTSRGANIDEDALLEALNSGKVRAAGLDVWAEEPTMNEALSRHPAVSALPHIGASTQEAQKRIGLEIIEIVKDFS